MILMHAPNPSVRSSQRIYFRKVRTDADSKSVHSATKFIHIPEHGLHMQTNAARFQTMPMLQGQTLPRVSCTPGCANAPQAPASRTNEPCPEFTCAGRGS